MQENLQFLRSIQVNFISGSEKKIFSSDFRIDFDVKATRNSTKDKSTISIYNLAPTTRQELSTKYKKIELIAGYANRRGSIFVGDISKVEISKNGADIITKITLLSGSSNLKLATVNDVYEQGTDLETVVRGVASSIPGITIGRVIIDQKKRDTNSLLSSGNYYVKKLDDVLTNTLNNLRNTTQSEIELRDSIRDTLGESFNTALLEPINGNEYEVLSALNELILSRQDEKVLLKRESFHGSSESVLNDLAKRFNGSWTIFNNVFEWVDNARATDTQRAHLISGDTGMVGYPDIDEKGANVKTLLNPYIRVNELVQLNSKFGEQQAQALRSDADTQFQGSGVFRVNDVRHTGSNYGGEFYTIMSLQKTINNNTTNTEDIGVVSTENVAEMISEIRNAVLSSSAITEIPDFIKESSRIATNISTGVIENINTPNTSIDTKRVVDDLVESTPTIFKIK